MPGDPGAVDSDVGGAAGAGSGAKGGAAAGAEGTKDKVAKAKAASSNKFKRVGGGKTWEDETLADWPESKHSWSSVDTGKAFVNHAMVVGSEHYLR